MHEGEQLQKLITLHNVKKIEFCNFIGIRRNSLDYWIHRDKVNIRYKFALAKFLKKDISDYFPELRDLPNYYNEIDSPPLEMNEGSDEYNNKLAVIQKKLNQADDDLAKLREEAAQKQRIIDQLLKTIREKDDRIQELKDQLKNLNNES